MPTNFLTYPHNRTKRNAYLNYDRVANNDVEIHQPGSTNFTGLTLDDPIPAQQSYSNQYWGVVNEIRSGSATTSGNHVGNGDESDGDEEEREEDDLSEDGDGDEDDGLDLEKDETDENKDAEEDDEDEFDTQSDEEEDDKDADEDEFDEDEDEYDLYDDEDEYDEDAA